MHSSISPTDCSWKSFRIQVPGLGAPDARSPEHVEVADCRKSCRAESDQKGDTVRILRRQHAHDEQQGAEERVGHHAPETPEFERIGASLPKLVHDHRRSNERLQ